MLDQYALRILVREFTVKTKFDYVFLRLLKNMIDSTTVLYIFNDNSLHNFVLF